MMEKEALKREINHLLINDYGEYGEERIINHNIVLPKSVMRRFGISVADENRSLIFDVFRSNTSSGIAVINYHMQVIDFMELTTEIAKKVYQAVKFNRRKERLL